MEVETKKMQLFDRLKDFPLIASICAYVQLKYEEAKKSEKFGELVVKAEKTLFEVAGKLEPIAKKMEDHISAIDELAIKGLNKLEEYFPITKKQPGEIKEALIAYAKELKDSGHLTVVMKCFLFLAAETAKLLLQVVICLAKGKFAMEMIIRITDYLLPPLKDEESFDSSSTERFKDYSSKVYKRLVSYKTNMIAKSSELKWDDLPLIMLPAKIYSVILALYYRLDFFGGNIDVSKDCESCNQ